MLQSWTALPPEIKPSLTWRSRSVCRQRKQSDEYFLAWKTFLNVTMLHSIYNIYMIVNIAKKGNKSL